MTTPVPTHARDRALFTATIFVAASLLFVVQPMVTKLLLPLVGGSAAVWNLAVVFFQAVLLGGYAFAHLAASKLTPKAHRVVQVVVLAVPLALLPVALPGIDPPAGTDPSLWVLAALALMVGAPFFALSTCSPTLQRWFSQSGHPDAADPYFLYASGNVGSFAALLAYPFVIEPRLPLAAQGGWWGWLYAGLVVLVAVCARATATTADATRPSEVESPAPTMPRRLLWAAGGFVPSFTMLAVTLHLTTDVAAVPLLWILPLSIFLLSFVVVFRPSAQRLMVPLAIAVVALSAVALRVSEAGAATWVEMALPLAILGAVSLLAHGRIYLARPPADRLTGFYLWMSLGGVLGGIVASLVVPVVFDTVVEYPVAIGLGLLFALPVVAAAASNRITKVVFSSLVVVVALAHAFVGFELTGGLSSEELHRERTFYGVHRVVRTGPDFHALWSGTTIHGEQDRSQSPPQPISYYTPNGPIGEVFGVAHARGPVASAVIGLGSGGLAAYGEPDDTMRFYEIDQAIVDIATDPDLFTYLEESEADIDVVVGDGRIELVRSGRSYDLVIMDAFTSDAIPIHLVTREAIADYLERVTPGGLVVVHISNRYVDLEGVLGNTADDLGLVGMVRSYDPPSGANSERSTRWVVLGEARGLVDDLGEEWHPLTPEGTTWTDDFADLVSVLDW